MYCFWIGSRAVAACAPHEIAWLEHSAMQLLLDFGFCCFRFRNHTEDITPLNVRDTNKSGQRHSAAHTFYF